MDSPMVRSQHAIVQTSETEAVLFGGYCESKNLYPQDLYQCDISGIDFNGKANELPGLVWRRVSQSGKVPAGRKGHSFVKVPGK